VPLLKLFFGNRSGAPATQDIAPTLFVDADTFYGPTVTTSYSVTPELYVDPDTFYAPTVTLEGAATQKDGDPDYWKLPWFNVEGIEGGTFADKLREKALTALEIAEDLAREAAPARAKRAVRKAAKGLQEYVKAAGALLSDDTITELGRTAKQLNVSASQWDRSELLERVSDARMALLAYEAAQQDDEEALIALMVS
jgi:hypothetical protein